MPRLQEERITREIYFEYLFATIILIFLIFGIVTRHYIDKQSNIEMAKLEYEQHIENKQKIWKKIVP